MLINKIRHTNIRRIHQDLWKSQILIPTSTPIMIFHRTSMHHHHSITCINAIIQTNYSIFQSHHKSSSLKDRTRLHHIGYSIVLDFTINAVTTFRHIDNSFHLTGRNLHQKGNTHIGVNLF